MTAFRAFRFDKRRGAKPVDALTGITSDMRDALEAATKSMLVFGDAGEVRSITHFSQVVCTAATARALLGRGFFAPVGDGECVRLTRHGERVARLSAARRASFQKWLQKEKRL